MSIILPHLASPTKQHIEILFNAMYHGKRSFSDFESAPVDLNSTRKSFTRAAKTRELIIPNDKLKSCHEFLRLFLLDFLPQNDQIVFSYRKGFSAYDAVKKHAASKSFFVCDIADFFPSIRRQRIASTLNKAGKDCPIADIDKWFDRIVDLVCVTNELPVGFSTSPIISNSALKPFDDALQEHCKNKNLIVTRYSDDIIVSGESLLSLTDIETNVEELLKDTMQGELTLNRKKSKFFHRGVKIKLLGMVLLPNGTISVDAEVKREIEVLMHYYLSDKSKFANCVGDNLKKAESRLSGLLNYVNTVDKHYLDKLRKKFGSSIVDYFLHRSFL
jgi:RNA-directed DNA polymerase